MTRYLVAHSDGQTDAAPLLGSFWERLESTAAVMATAFERDASIEWSIVSADGPVTAGLARPQAGIRYTSDDGRNTVVLAGFDDHDSVTFLRAVKAARPDDDEYDAHEAAEERATAYRARR